MSGGRGGEWWMRGWEGGLELGDWGGGRGRKGR